MQPTRRQKKCPIPATTFTNVFNEGLMYFRNGELQKTLMCLDKVGSKNNVSGFVVASARMIAVQSSMYNMQICKLNMLRQLILSVYKWEPIILLYIWGKL
jgi:hypothetical protein